MYDQSTAADCSILETIREFIVENFFFGVDDPNLTGDLSFLESGTVDSTGILEIVAFVEQEYSIQVGDAEMTPENLDSLNRISRFVASKL